MNLLTVDDVVVRPILLQGVSLGIGVLNRFRYRGTAHFGFLVIIGQIELHDKCRLDEFTKSNRFLIVQNRNADRSVSVFASKNSRG